VRRREGRYPETGYNGVGFFVNGVTQGWLLSGLAPAYATGMVASLILVAYTPVFMPYLTYEKVRDTESPQPGGADRYLSHAEGHRHVIHRYRNEQGDRWYGVAALDEDNVGNARVIPDKPPQPPRRPLPWPQNADQNRCGAPTLRMDGNASIGAVDRGRGGP
jgi:hypothetical protein